jgi:hypothetical protein
MNLSLIRSTSFKTLKQFREIMCVISIGLNIFFCYASQIARRAQPSEVFQSQLRSRCNAKMLQRCATVSLMSVYFEIHPRRLSLKNRYLRASNAPVLLPTPYLSMNVANAFCIGCSKNSFREKSLKCYSKSKRNHAAHRRFFSNNLCLGNFIFRIEKRFGSKNCVIFFSLCWIATFGISWMYWVKTRQLLVNISKEMR